MIFQTGPAACRKYGPAPRLRSPLPCCTATSRYSRAGSRAALKALRGRRLLDRRHPRRDARRRAVRAARPALRGALAGPSVFAARYGDVDDLARRSPAGSSPAACSPGTGRVPAAELGRGRGHVLGDRRSSVRSRCRSCTSTARRKSGSSSAQSGARVLSPPIASATSTCSPTSSRSAPTLHALELVFVLGDTPGRLPALLRPHRRNRWSSRPARVDPNAPALVIYTSGTTADPKGVVHSHRTMGFETRQLAAMMAGRGAADPRRRADRARDRHARRVADPRVESPGRAPHRRVGCRRRVLAIMLEDQIYGRDGLDDLPHQPARPSRLHRRARRAHAAVGARRLAGARRRWASAPLRSDISIVRSYGSSEHPSITGCRPRSRPRSASTPTAARWRATRSASSTTTATTSPSASRARCGAAGPSASSATRTRAHEEVLPGRRLVRHRRRRRAR